MLGDKKNNYDDLGSQNINLLPDAMRVAEDKDRRSGRSNEHGYELRAPKKEKKIRQRFSWLPFFGKGWAAQDTAATAAKTDAPSRVVVDIDRIPSDADRASARGPASTSGMDTIHVFPGTGVPEMRRSFKKGILFPSFRFRGSKKLPVALPVAKPIQSKTSVSQSGFEAPPRHYSLLPEQAPLSGRPIVAVPTPPPTMPMTGSLSMPRPFSPATPSINAIPKKHGGFFAWLRKFFGGHEKPLIRLRDQVGSVTTTESAKVAAAPALSQIRPSVSIPQVPRPVVPVAPKSQTPMMDIRSATAAPAPQMSAPIKPTKQKTHHIRGGALHMPMRSAIMEAVRDMREVNLIPVEFSLFSWQKIVHMLVIAFLVTIAFMGSIYGVLTLWQKQVETRTALIDTQIDKYKNDILVQSKIEPEITALSNRILMISALIDQHIYWTNFFSLLEKYTLPDVYYDGLSATTNGSLSLSAHGSNYETVSRLLKLLNDPGSQEFVTSASVTGVQQVTTSTGGDQVDFTIELVLNPKLFMYRHASR